MPSNSAPISSSRRLVIVSLLAGLLVLGGISLLVTSPSRSRSKGLGSLVKTRSLTNISSTSGQWDFFPAIAAASRPSKSPAGNEASPGTDSQPAGQDSIVPEESRLLDYQQHNALEESKQVHAIIYDPRVKGAVEDALQLAPDAPPAIRVIEGMKAALAVINSTNANRTVLLSPSANSQGVPFISSRVKALAVGQIGDDLRLRLQNLTTERMPANFPVTPPSRFGQNVSWDTPVNDTYGDQYFAMCLAIKNQHKDIREWVGHHKAVGAGKLYVFDAGSEPPLDGVLRDYIDSGLVEHIWSPPDFGTEEKRQHPQLKVYTECMDRFGSRHQFLGYLDSDEFLILENGTPSVPALLRRMMAFEPFGGLVVNWRVFGSSGHRTRPEGGVLNSYTQCLSFHNGHTIHIKSIVNTKLGANVAGPHHWTYKDGFYAVNEHFQRVKGPKNDNITYDKIAIHHYVLKSFEEYLEKSARGSAMGNHKPLSFFGGIDAQATHNCTQAIHLGPYP